MMTVSKVRAAGWPRWAGLPLLLAVSVPVGAQEVDLSRPLTADECVGIALRESNLIGEAQARVDRSGGAAKAATRVLLPSISGSASWSQERFPEPQRRFKDVGGVYREYYSDVNYWGRLAVNAQQALLDLPGFTDWRGGQVSLAAARCDLDATRADVELNTRASFHGCVAAIKLAEVEEDAVAVAREQLRRAETLFNLGSVARSDVLQAKVNLADAEMNLISRRNSVRVEHSRLGLVMGLNPSLDLAVDTALVIPAVDPAGEIEDWIARALAARPDVDAARSRLRVAELAERSAKLSYLPTLGASIGWSRSSSSGTDQYLRDDAGGRSWYVGLGFDVTLFDGLGREGRVQSAVADRRVQSEAMQRLEKEVALEVKDSFLTIRKERESLHAARESVRLAEENLRLQQALYESGAGTLLEWDNARLDLRRAKVSLIQAEINLLMAHLRFQKAVGE